MSRDGQRAWRDRKGRLWLEAEDPDSARTLVFCYTGNEAALIGAHWEPAREFGAADAEFGPMLELEALAKADDDIVLFLTGGGKSVPVPPDWAERRWGWRDREFEPMVPGYEILLLAVGETHVQGSEYVNSAYVVIRRTR